MNDALCRMVIFVIGFPHSGTTLLGMMLGGGSGVLFAGEVHEFRFRSDTERPLYKKACRACGGDCAVWNALSAESNVYESLARASGRHTIVDTTKEPLSWIEENAEHLEEAYRSLILLMRDPRAVITSRAREFPDVPLEKHIDAWVQYTKESEAFFEKFSGKKIRVRYEDLATRPKETLERVCREIDLHFEERMLSPWDGDHHPLRGNIGTQSIARPKTAQLALLRHMYDKDHPETTTSRHSYYDSHPPAITLDTRWQTELSSEQLALIEEQTEDLFKAYLWPHY